MRTEHRSSSGRHRSHSSEGASEGVPCPLCGMAVPEGSMEIHRLAEEYVLEKIREDHPEWIESDGACPKCSEFYRAL